MKNIILATLFSAVFLMSSCCSCRKAANVKPIEGSAWSLIEMNAAVIDRGNNSGQYSLVFGKDGRINGMGNCNRYFGTYKIEDGNEIEFSGIGSTRMMCPNQGIENQFFKMLDEVDKFKMDGEFLILMDDGKILASFKVSAQPLE